MVTKEAPAREKAAAKVPTQDLTEQLIEPFGQLRTEVDRFFDNFPLRMPTLRLGRFTLGPAVDMTETDKRYRITAELPGLDAENVDVSYEDGFLRIAGEKREERDEKERGYRLTERSYGAFDRLIELPPAADPEKMQAKFRNGVLNIVIPKKDAAKRNLRKIEIQKG